MRIQLILFFFLTFSLLFGSCSSNKKSTTKTNNTETEMSGNTQAGPKVFIYKTSKDYFDKVPVNLREGKNEIASYPDIKDVFYKGELAYPTRLENGFLMDNRGIGKNTAFLSYTYEEYSQLEKTPDAKQLFEKIIDNDPFTEIYQCGRRYDYKDIKTELNDIIESNQLDKFVKVK